MIRTLRNWLIAAAAAAASGCAFNGPDQAMTIAEEHPITVDSQAVTLTLDLAEGQNALSAQDKTRVRAFADSYLVAGHGPIALSGPSGSSRDGAGRSLIAAAQDYLVEVGVDASMIAPAAYRAADDRGRQVVLSYTRYVATPSACGNWAGLRSRDYRNLRSPNFGCATQNNIAAMVADPRDLTEPADAGSADAMARIRGLKAYREGEKTASETDTDIKADVAN
jgi:pilus assembly protein CpaD